MIFLYLQQYKFSKDYKSFLFHLHPRMLQGLFITNLHGLIKSRRQYCTHKRKNLHAIVKKVMSVALWLQAIT